MDMQIRKRRSDIVLRRFYPKLTHGYSAAPKYEFVSRGKVRRKGLLCPLSKAEKQGLIPQDIVPLKSHAKKRIRKAGPEPEIQNRGPQTPESSKYEWVLTELQLPWPWTWPTCQTKGMWDVMGNIYKYLIDSLLLLNLICICVFAYSGNQQNHKAGGKNTKDTIQKNVPKGFFMYLRICSWGKEIKALAAILSIVLYIFLLEGNLPKPGNPYCGPTDQQPTDWPLAEESKYSLDRARRCQCPTNNLLEVRQNLANFGGRPIGGTVETLLTKVVNRRSSVSLIVVFFVAPAPPHHC